MKVLTALIIDDKATEITPLILELKARFKVRNIDLVSHIRESTNEGKMVLKENNSCDVILLDIVKVADKNPGIFNEFFQINPYIPIIMLSDQKDPEEIIKYIDLGAGSYITKASLVYGIEAQDRTTKYMYDLEWAKVMDKIIKHTNQYHPIKEILNESIEEGIIEKSDTIESSIYAQTEFLKNIGHYRAATFFPKILAGPFTKGNRISYEMPFYKMKSLRHLLFEESSHMPCFEIAEDVLTKVLNFTFYDLSIIGRTENEKANYVSDIHLKKFHERMERFKNRVAQKNINFNPVLQELDTVLQSEECEIDSKICKSPGQLLKLIENDKHLMSLLEPPFFSTIHGDLHFDNILIDNRLAKKIKILLIDPKGFQFGTSDYAYDVGKLLFSSSGEYDFIHQGHLKVQFNGVNSASQLYSFEFVYSDWGDNILSGGISGAKLTLHKRAIKPWVRSVFDNLTEIIKTKVQEFAKAASDPNLWLRAKFSEAMHFCTIGVLHSEEDLNRALAMLLRGIQLLNKFWEDYELTSNKS